MHETITSTEQTWASTLMTAAEVASRFGPEGGVQLVLPRRPGLVRRAELIAQETGVDVQILKITEGAVHLRFVARGREHSAEGSAVGTTSLPMSVLGRLGTWLQLRVQRWRAARHMVAAGGREASAGPIVPAPASDAGAPSEVGLP